MDWLTKACEEIDAGVFSGDLLWIKVPGALVVRLSWERRELLKRYITRWQRAVDEHGDEDFDDDPEAIA